MVQPSECWIDGCEGVGVTGDASLPGIKVVFCDLDGTLYLGDQLIPGARGFLERCHSRGIRPFFLSNNSSRSVEQYVEKLIGLGIPASADDVLLSTHDLLSWLNKKGVREVFLVGTTGMRSMFTARGFVTDSRAPEYVVLGYDTEVTYGKLATATVHLHRGIPLVASHPDLVCPVPDGGLPDAGSFLALLEAATGVRPVHVCGKPNAGMVLHKLNELGVAANQSAVIGDRLYTDVEMAKRSGAMGILVLSGEATRDDVENAPQQPDLVLASVDDLLR